MELTIAEIGEYLKKFEEKSPKKNVIDHFWKSMTYSYMLEATGAELVAKLKPLVPKGYFYSILKRVITFYPQQFKKFGSWINYDVALVLLEYLEFLNI